MEDKCQPRRYILSSSSVQSSFGQSSSFVVLFSSSSAPNCFGQTQSISPSVHLSYCSLIMKPYSNWDAHSSFSEGVQSIKQTKSSHVPISSGGSDQSSSLGSKLLWSDTIDFSFSSFVVLQSRHEAIFQQGRSFILF